MRPILKHADADKLEQRDLTKHEITHLEERVKDWESKKINWTAPQTYIFPLLTGLAAAGYSHWDLVVTVTGVVIGFFVFNVLPKILNPMSNSYRKDLADGLARVKTGYVHIEHTEETKINSFYVDDLFLRDFKKNEVPDVLVGFTDGDYIRVEFSPHAREIFKIEKV